MKITYLKRKRKIKVTKYIDNYGVLVTVITSTK